MQHAARVALAEPADAVWQVRLLGGFAIDDGQQHLTRLRSRAAVALLARVAMAPQRQHAREELVALLWPDAPAEAGRNRLRQTLSTLKAVLEPPGRPPVLLADRRVVRAAPGAFWCDATVFEQAARGGRPDAARALYAGELLPGFYDEWIEDERRRLAHLHERLPPGHAPSGAAAGPGHAQASPQAGAGSRLPHYLSQLVGADQAGARLLARIGEHRLVTVLGPGGAGKTRLAVEVAHLAIRAAPARPAAFDAAAFVSLVDVESATGLHDRLLQALRLHGGADASGQLRQALAGRRMLLVLDNADLLDDGAVAALAALAADLPGVHWLATSRRPLGLDGEQESPLDLLPLPDPHASLDEVVMNPAVALFADRARAHRIDFHVGPSQRAPLVALVRWLQGLPLALELAAAQVRSVGPAELLALLQQARDQPGAPALDHLARRGRRRGDDPRHASMRAVVEGSWRLLSPAEQAMLTGLSLLPAGATAEIAAALGAPEGQPPLPPLQAQALLDALLAQSVLRWEAGASGLARHAPYEPVREFALGRLDDGQRRQLRRRLLDALLAWAAAMPETPPLPAVRDELPTLTMAIAQAAADGRADTAARLVLTLQSSWGEIALPGGVLQAIDTLLAAPGLDDGLAAGCHALAATRHQEAGRPDDARRHRDRALARLAACAAPEPAVQVMVLGRAARLFWRLDRDAARARALVDQALPIARVSQRPNSEASLLSLLGHLATTVDRDPVRGTALAEQALALWMQSGNRHLVNAGRFNVATNRMKGGHFAEVLDEFAALAQEGRDLQDWDLAAGALETRGTALQHLRRWAESAADLRQSVRLAWEGMETMALAYALWNLPPALARLRQGELAAQTMGAAEALWLARFGVLGDDDRRDLRRMRRLTRVLLGTPAADAAWRRGAQMPLADAVRAVLGG